MKHYFLGLVLITVLISCNKETEVKELNSNNDNSESLEYDPNQSAARQESSYEEFVKDSKVLALVPQIQTMFEGPFKEEKFIREKTEVDNQIKELKIKYPLFDIYVEMAIEEEGETPPPSEKVDMSCCSTWETVQVFVLGGLACSELPVEPTYYCMELVVADICG